MASALLHSCALLSMLLSAALAAQPSLRGFVVCGAPNQPVPIREASGATFVPRAASPQDPALAGVDALSGWWVLGGGTRPELHQLRVVAPAAATAATAGGAGGPTVQVARSLRLPSQVSDPEAVAWVSSSVVAVADEEDGTVLLLDLRRLATVQPGEDRRGKGEGGAGQEAVVGSFRLSGWQAVPNKGIEGLAVLPPPSGNASGALTFVLAQQESPRRLLQMDTAPGSAWQVMFDLDEVAARAADNTSSADTAGGAGARRRRKAGGRGAAPLYELLKDLSDVWVAPQPNGTSRLFLLSSSSKVVVEVGLDGELVDDQVLRVEGRQPEGLAFSPDLRHMLVASEGSTITLYSSDACAAFAEFD